MGFENHRRIGLLERASQIALKYGVVYNATQREFRGDSEGVRMASAKLAQRMDAEASRARRT